LSANLIADYVVGVAVAYFAQAPGIAPEWQLLVITGFCSGLSNFSTFSAEVVALPQQGKISWAMGVIGVHVTPIVHVHAETAPRSLKYARVPRSGRFLHESY
jgi:CrcB protein